MSLETAVVKTSHSLALARISTSSLQLLATSGVIIYKLCRQKTGWLTWLMLFMLWISYICDIIGEIFYCLGKHDDTTTTIRDYVDFHFEDT